VSDFCKHQHNVHKTHAQCEILKQHGQEYVTLLTCKTCKTDWQDGKEPEPNQLNNTLLSLLKKQNKGWKNLVATYWQSLKQHAANGFGTVSQEVYDERTQACKSCDLIKEDGKTCGVCGCDVTEKCWWEVSSCPHPNGAKWISLVVLPEAPKLKSPCGGCGKKNDTKGSG
jgi:hypothetical protein